VDSEHSHHAACYVTDWQALMCDVMNSDVRPTFEALICSRSKASTRQLSELRLALRGDVKKTWKYCTYVCDVTNTVHLCVHSTCMADGRGCACRVQFLLQL
jgi:hypothetical protein